MLSRISRVLFVVVTIALLTSPAWATPLAPIAVTGYNADPIFGPDGGSGGGFAANVMSGCGFFMTGTISNSAYNQNGVSIPAGTPWPNGLPVGPFSSLLNATHIYQIAPNGAGGDTEFDCTFYSGYGAPVTATLVTQGKYDAIGLLATTANGNHTATGTVTLNYADGTSSSALTLNAMDWCGNDPDPTGCKAVGNFYRASGVGTVDGFNSGDGGYNDKGIFETVVAADPLKMLKSITMTGYSNGTTVIFAISGDAVGGTAPEPGTLTLLAAGLAGLLCYAWRKRR